MGMSRTAYTYDVYGEPTVTGSLANEFDFAGQQTDGSTGLQYLRARYYDPATGTFLSRDPLAAEPVSAIASHSYVGGNPISFIDPTGLCRWWDIQCHLRGLSGLNESEWFYCNRGPNTAMKCLGSLEDANDAVTRVSAVFGDEDTDRTAAYRHCMWSGFMACRWGSGQAKIFGDLHEDYEGNPENNKQLGQWNNRVGRTIGEYYRGRSNAKELIAEECLDAVFDGRLFTSRHVFDPGYWDAH
jgi:RHS repeat-associated protein